MIIHGGYGGTSSLTYLNSAARYNPSTNSWTTISSTGSPRLEDHSGIWLGTKLLISGGSSNIFNVPGAAFQSSAYTYDPILNTWQVAGLMGVNKVKHKLIMGNNIVLCFGGGTTFLNPTTSTVSFAAGVPNGSRYFLNSTPTNQTLIGNVSKLYLYKRQ
jgi:N-acetylneuraminic acid mutarotase